MPSVRIASLLRGIARVALMGGAALCLLTEATPAAAQSLTRGSIQGTVRDSASRPLFDVRVALRDSASGYARSVVTDRSGRYQFGFLPAGSYALVAERFGYRPLQVGGVVVAAGQSVRVPLALRAAAPPVQSVDSARFPGAGAAATQPGVQHVFGRTELHGLPLERREVAELARMSSISSDDFAIEGLPSSLNALFVDGMLVRPAAGSGAGGAGLPLLPLSAFDGAWLLSGYPDAEVSGMAGGAVSLLSRRGTGDFRVGAFGSWSTGGVQGAGAGDPIAESLTGLQGGAVVSGPIGGEAATFTAGAEFWSLDTPFVRPLAADSIGREVLAVANDHYGLALDAEATPVTRRDVLSLFGRVDWELSSAHALRIGAVGAAIGSPENGIGSLAAVPPGALREGSDVVASASLLSRLTDRVVQEVRIGAQSSSRDSRAAPGGLPTYSAIGGDGLSLGGGLDVSGAARFERMEVQASGTWHFDLSPHQLKAGVYGAYASHERDTGAALLGGYRFAGPEELARGEGVVTQTAGALPTASFDIPRAGAFLQDRWSATETLQLTAGVRYEMERFPAGDVRPNQPWFEQSRILNADVPGWISTISPRLGFEWDASGDRRWLVHGSAGRYAGLIDEGFVSDLLVDDGRVEVRRAIGEFDGWPAAPDEEAAPVVGPSLTLVASGYRPPRSLRGSLGVSHVLDSRTAVHVTGVYRRTDRLARRVDLNLSPVPAAVDASGRPLYGTLVKQGGMVAVEPGSNRRFPDFDVVSAINADGSATYMGGTVAVEHRASEGLNLFGSYTYSRTEDDWFAGAGEGAVNLYPAPVAPDLKRWVEGTSDLDVPHRLSLGGEVQVPGFSGARLSGLYRYQSGAPFTPGFGGLMDANGDGFAGNDPAHVSDAVTGMETLLRNWDCLDDQVGGLAERNSCRAGGRHALDLRLAVRLARLAGSPAEIFIDGLNLTGSAIEVPDPGLYRVDPDAELRVASDGTVTLPLLANENFGNPLIRYAAGRQLRIGLRIVH